MKEKKANETSKQKRIKATNNASVVKAQLATLNIDKSKLERDISDIKSKLSSLNNNKNKQKKYKESTKELCLYDSESDQQMSESSDPVTQEINVLEF